MNVGNLARRGGKLSRGNVRVLFEIVSWGVRFCTVGSVAGLAQSAASGLTIESTGRCWLPEGNTEIELAGLNDERGRGLSDQ